MSLMSNPARAESCQPALTFCAGAQSQPMNCCKTAQCHCDISAPSQPLPNALPLRATSTDGQQLAIFAPLPVSAIRLVANEDFSLHSSVGSSNRQAVVPFFVLTHAFLI
jgi:hypothetical protein